MPDGSLQSIPKSASQPRLPRIMEASVDPQPRGPDWMPITPKTGSLLHADSHFAVRLFASGRSPRVCPGGFRRQFGGAAGAGPAHIREVVSPPDYLIKNFNKACAAYLTPG